MKRLMVYSSDDYALITFAWPSDSQLFRLGDAVSIGGVQDGMVTAIYLDSMEVRRVTLWRRFWYRFMRRWIWV